MCVCERVCVSVCVSVLCVCMFVCVCVCVCWIVYARTFKDRFIDMKGHGVGISS